MNIMYLPLNLRTRLLPNELDNLLKLHSYKILDCFFFKKPLILDFPGSPVVTSLLPPQEAEVWSTIQGSKIPHVMHVAKIKETKRVTGPNSSYTFAADRRNQCQHVYSC